MPRYKFNDKNVNYARISYVILHYGKEALVEALKFVINRDCPTMSSLQHILAAPGLQAALCNFNPRLTRPQKELLYPGGNPSTTVVMDDLDISLASFLLRNVPLFTGNRPPMATAWHTPTALDLSFYPLESNVGLLREKRNKLQGHLKKPELNNVDFQNEFQELRDIIVNIMTAVGSTSFSSKDLESIKSHPMSSENVYNILDDLNKLNYLESIQVKVEETRHAISQNLAVGVISVLLLLFLIFLLSVYYNIFNENLSTSNSSLHWRGLHWFVDRTINKMNMKQGEQIRDLMEQIIERLVTPLEKMLFHFYLFVAVFGTLMAWFGQRILQKLFQPLERLCSDNNDNFEPYLREVTKYFTGRDEKSFNISRLIIECKARLINIVGPPGFGKTTVALHVGHELRNNGYKVAFVRIQRNTTVEQISAAFLEAFGLEIPIATEADCREKQMFMHVKSLKQKTVIIFDNAEDAFTISEGTELSNCAKRQREFSDMLAEIFERNSLVQVILTSRQKFLLSHSDVRVEEKEVEITCLPEKASAELLRKVAPSISEESAFVLGSLLGGVPLLLESTAGIIENAQPAGYLTAEDIIEDIKRKESVLNAYKVDDQERMFHLLDIAYSKLPPVLQDLWETISLFPDSCGREAIVEILEIEASDVKIYCSELIERFLLYRSSGPTKRSCLPPYLQKFFSCNSGLTERYCLHPVLQDFGNMKRKKQPKKDYEALQKFCQHFLKRMIEICIDFTDKKDLSNSMLAISYDFANYRKMFLCASCDTGLCGESIFVTCFEASYSSSILAVMQDKFFYKLPDVNWFALEACSAERVVSIPTEEIVSEATRICKGFYPPETAYLYLLFCLGFVINAKDFSRDMVVQLEVLIDRALDIFELGIDDSDDKLGMARAYSLKGCLYQKLKKIPEAIEKFKKAVEFYEPLTSGLNFEAAYAFYCIGNLYQQMDSDPDLQIEYFEKAAQVFNVELMSSCSQNSNNENWNNPAALFLRIRVQLEGHACLLPNFLRVCLQREADKVKAKCIFEKEVKEKAKGEAERLNETVPAPGKTSETVMAESLLTTTPCSVQQSLDNMIRKLEDKRSAAGRPLDVEEMSREQIQHEKLAMQKALLQHERVFGRPTSEKDKDVMRPLYDRYRLVKRTIAKPRPDKENFLRSPSGTKLERKSRSMEKLVDLEPIHEDSLLHGPSDEDNELRNRATTHPNPLSKDSPVTSNRLTTPLHVNTLTDSETPSEPHSHLSETLTFDDTFSVTKIHQEFQEKSGNVKLHEMSEYDLRLELESATKDKKKLRKKLKKFEDDFVDRTGRKVQKEERGDMGEEYSKYKQIKAKLRLLEALLNKRQASRTL